MLVAAAYRRWRCRWRRSKQGNWCAIAPRSPDAALNASRAPLPWGVKRRRVNSDPPRENFYREAILCGVRFRV